MHLVIHHDLTGEKARVTSKYVNQHPLNDTLNAAHATVYAFENIISQWESPYSFRGFRTVYHDQRELDEGEWFYAEYMPQPDQQRDDLHMFGSCLIRTVPTDPYGHCRFTVGSDEDFVAFDARLINAHVAILHAVVNSETGHFIMNFDDPEACLHDDLIYRADVLILRARDWCADNDVTIDVDGGESFLSHIEDLSWPAHTSVV